MKFVLATLLLAILSPISLAQPAWDASRYMRVAEVKAGMTGYGLTVFSGSKIEKFDVQVIDVLKNLVNPKCDVVLISCKGAYMDHVGPVEGMSGSPIYLYDASDTARAHPRMIGAFAYGWEYSKDPVAGVQPIEYMLNIPVPSTAAPATGEKSAAAPATPTPVNQISLPRWSLANVPALPGLTHNAAGFMTHSLAVDPVFIADSQRLRPLATPVETSGISASAARRLAPMFASSGLDLLEAGAAGGSELAHAKISLEPGSVLVAPLLTGDIEMNAVGTCTEVRGDAIYGFGHEFNNEGPIRLPMGSGTVATVIADLHSSFKLGALSEIVGTLTNDQTVGIAGRVGEPAPMVPIHIRIHYADGSLDQTYNCLSVLHPKFTPLVAAAAVQAALAGVKDLPEYHTLNYDLTVDFQGGKSVHVLNKDVNSDAADLAQQLVLPIMAAAENPFIKVPVKEITGTINVSSEPRLAQITAISLPKLKYEPGATVDAYVVYRPWRAGEQTLPITFTLPRDLPNGDYQLVVSDWERYFSDQRQAEPFRYTAESIDDLFSVVTDFEAIRHDALYVRLVRQPDGVSVGRAAMPRLPASERLVLLGAGHSDMAPFVTSSVQTIPTDLVMSGAAEFTLTIDRSVHVETARLPRPTTQP